MEYQYLADRGPWHREKIWHTETDGQPAFCLPPVAHVGSGPSGLAAYPGTGLTPHFAGRFLLADFKGGAANSCIRSFRVVPRGGSFAIADEEQTITNVLATDVEIGPDGAIWVCDWVHGWDGDGKGRLWRFLPRERSAADAATVAEVRGLLGGDWAALDADRLVAILGHADRRIRLEAQWELVRRGDRDRLAVVLADASRPTLARVHAAQGLAQSLRHGEAAAAGPLVAAAADPAADLRLVVARCLGDCPTDLSCRGAVRRVLIDRLIDGDLQVVATAATSLGRLGRRDGDDDAAMAAIRTLVSSSPAADRAVRHAVAVAIAGVASPDALDALLGHDSPEVRLIVCVALRRLGDPRIAALLDDSSDAVAVEAARAIHDLPIKPLLPALASRAARGPADDAFLRRAVSAAEQVGTRASAEALVAVIARADAASETRREAIAALETWAAPPRVNRVTGVWLPDAAARDPAPARDAVAAAMDRLVVSGAGGLDEESRSALLAAAGRLGVADVAPLLRAWAADHTMSAASRARALDTLDAAGDAEAVGLADRLRADPEPPVRMASRRLRAARQAPEAIVPDLVSACGGPDVAERQQAVDLLAAIEAPAAVEALAALVEKLRAGTLDPTIALEVGEAAGRLGAAPAVVDPQDPLAAWSDTLSGGDASRGRQIFFAKEAVSCVRCHQVEGRGGDVGPKLDGIAATRDARYLLEAVVHPGARVADGYATTVIITDDGRAISGILVAETPDRLTLKLPDGTRQEVPTAAVEERASGPSSMPADLATKLSRRELRDLMAWLQGLR